MLKVTQKIYEQYKAEVRGNEDTTYEQVCLKFERNSRLSKSNTRKNKGGSYHRYGKLHFIVNDKNIVVWMKNRCPAPKGWKKNDREYLRLNRELGIESHDNMMSLMVRDVYLGSKRKFNGIKWKFKNRQVVGNVSNSMSE